MTTYDVFISYRTSSRDGATAPARNLRAQGYDVFLQAWALIPGHDFTQTFYKALQEAKKAILVATPDASESGWVQQEYNAMFHRRQSYPSFVLVAVVLGEFPDFPFLQNV